MTVMMAIVILMVMVMMEMVMVMVMVMMEMVMVMMVMVMMVMVMVMMEMVMAMMVMVMVMAPEVLRQVYWLRERQCQNTHRLTTFIGQSFQKLRVFHRPKASHAKLHFCRCVALKQALKRALSDNSHSQSPLISLRHSELKSKLQAQRLTKLMGSSHLNATKVLAKQNRRDKLTTTIAIKK